MQKPFFLLVVLCIAILVVGCGEKQAVGGVSADAAATQAAQIQAGEAVYQAQCAACHEMGRSAAVLNDKTLATYENAKKFFDYISTTMPRSAPGALKTQEYWDISAYVISNIGKLPKDTILSASNAESISVK